MKKISESTCPQFDIKTTYKVLLENSADGIAVMNKNGEVSLLPLASQKMSFHHTFFLKNPSEILTTLHPGDISAFQDSWRLLLNHPNQVYRITFRHKIPDGSYLWIEGTYTNLLGTKNIQGIVGSFRDITNWKKSEIHPQNNGKIENAYDHSENRYQQLFEHHPLPMFVVDSKTLNFEQVNNAAVLQYGYSAEEFSKLNLNDIRVQDGSSFSFSDDYAEGTTYSDVVRHKTKSGKHLYVRVSWSKILINKKPCWLAGCVDVSDEVQYREELSSSQKQLSLIFNNIDHPMWLIKVDEEKKLRYLAVNNSYCEKLQIKKTDIEGKTRDKINYDDEYVKSLYDKVITTGKAIRERTQLEVNEELKHIELSLIPVKSEDGITTEILGLALDVTEKINYQRQLMGMYERLRQLTSYLIQIREDERQKLSREIHDELGQLLTTIKIEVYWISRMRHSITDVQQRAESILSLLDSTFITVRRIATDLRPAMLDDLGLMEAIEWYGKEFEKRTGITFDLKSNANSAMIDKGITTAVYRVFQESLTNIWKHAQATAIFCELEITNDIIQMLIKDDGIGFDFTAVQKEKRTLGILGMRERISLIYGTYHIESTIGGGTITTVEIPLYATKKENTYSR